MENRFTCPCCGHQSFKEWPGSFSICNICFWEDDSVQLLDPAYKGGANRLSLIECQENFLHVGACQERFVKNVRRATAEEPIDPLWRRAVPADFKNSRTPASLSPEEYENIKVWYYWL